MKTKAAISLICLFLLLVFCPISVKAKSQVVIKALTFLPKGNTGVDTTFQFIDRVNELAKGELLIRYIGGPDAIPMFEQPDAVRMGAVDMIFNVTGFYVGLMPEGLSMQLSKISPMEERRTGYYDLMVDLHKKKLNSYYLGRFSGQRPFFVGINTIINKPSDLKGKRLSTGRICDPFIKELGAMAQFMPLTDVYTALERGVIDGGVFATGSFLTFHWNEVTKYLINHPLFPAQNNTILVNLDKWNKIPKHLQDILKDAAIELEPKALEYYKKETAMNLRKAEDSGVKLIGFSQKDADWWDKTAYEAQWKEVKEKVSPDLYEKLRKATE